MIRDLSKQHAIGVGQWVRQARGQRSGQWVADRVTELGQPMSRTTISELENGKRNYITTGEAMALMAALAAPTDRHLAVVPDLESPAGSRTLTVNGVTVTGEVQSISAHTYGDGSQSIEISFMPDNADDTVRVIESMRVDR